MQPTNQDLTPANDTERLDGILSADGPMAICTWDESCSAWVPMVCADGRRRIDSVLAEHEGHRIRRAQADHLEDVAEQRAMDRADWAANEDFPLGRVA